MQNELVLVTGVSGFLGSHIILQLLEKGYRVRGSVRDPARNDSLLNLFKESAPADASIELVQLDLTKDDGWSEAASGCDYILHIASPIPLNSPKERDALVGPARDGAIRALRAAKGAGCKRVVLTSSLASVSYQRQHDQDHPYTEEDWSDPENPDISPYIRSKILAERAAWQFAKENQIDLATICPGIILGPVLENDIGTSAEVVKQLMDRTIPLFPRFGFAVVDVRDVASMHIEAMTNPAASGQRFNCGGEFMWMEDIGRVLREAYPDRKLPSRRMPNWLVHIAAIFNPPLRATLGDLGRTQIVSHDKATRLLNWNPRSEKEAILATAESLIARNIV